jgi:hypothetical protein
MNKTQIRYRRSLTNLAKCLALIVIFCFSATLPALAQEITDSGAINPQQLLQNALVQIQNLGFIAIRFS